MIVPISSILRLEPLKGIYVLAGETGLNRMVNRISVVDVMINENSNQMLFGEGDLFITSLEFLVGKEESKVSECIDAFIKYKSSGVIIVSEDNIGLINDSIKQKCDEARLPLLCLPEELPYVDIMLIVNRFLLTDNLNTLRNSGLQRVLHGDVSEHETMEILDSFNTGIEENLAVVCFKGMPYSEIYEMDFQIHTLSTCRDVYIGGNGYKYYIISANNELKLKKRVDTVKAFLSNYFDIKHIGISQKYFKWELKAAVKEAKASCVIAESMEKKEFKLDFLSSYPMLLALKGSHEMRAFRNSFLSLISQNASADHKEEILETIREYVLSGGNYRIAAEKIGQHENTIRYRIGRVKTWLGMEENNLQFNETISLFVKIEQISGEI